MKGKSKYDKSKLSEWALCVVLKQSPGQKGRGGEWMLVGLKEVPFLTF